MIDRLIDAICRGLAVLMVACLGLMVAMVFGNVVLRYGFDSGIAVSEELSRWLFVWMTFMGALVAMRRHAHLGTDLLVSRLPVAGRRICLGLTHLLMLWLSGLMVRGAWEQTVINAGTASAAMQAPMAWLYASGVAFGVLACLIVAHDFWRLLSGRLAESELIGVVESEDSLPATGSAGSRGAAS